MLRIYNILQVDQIAIQCCNLLIKCPSASLLLHFLFFLKTFLRSGLHAPLVFEVSHEYFLNAVFGHLNLTHLLWLFNTCSVDGIKLFIDQLRLSGHLEVLFICAHDWSMIIRKLLYLILSLKLRVKILNFILFQIVD